MILNVNELKNFFFISSMVKQNNVLPILSYIKVDVNKLIKTNLSTYVIHEISPTGETLLLDEGILSNLVKNTRSKEIKVERKDNRVLLSDGFLKLSFAWADDKNYPTFPAYEKNNEVELDYEVLQAIGIASKNIMTSQLKSNFDYIHLANGYVFGSDRERFYYKKFDGLPTVSIDFECANVISKLSKANFYESGNYNFFETTTTLYGFIKPETKAPDFMALLKFFNKDKYFEINVKDLTDFMDTVVSSSPTKIIACSMDGGKLSFNDPDYEVTVDVEIPFTGDFLPKLNFLPRTFEPFFKSLGLEKVRLSPMHTDWSVSVWSEDEPDMIGMVAGTNPNGQA